MTHHSSSGNKVLARPGSLLFCSRLLIPVLICLLFLPRVPQAQEPLIASTSVGPPLYFENGNGFFNLLAAELFRRLDLDYRLDFLPAQRSLVFTNDGKTDVIIGRAAAIEKRLPNIIRVPVNILDFEYTAYTKDPDLRIDGWQSLDGYTVGIINGWKIIEQNVGSAKQVVKVNDFGQLLSLLDIGRVDVAIMDRIMGEWTFRQLGLDLNIVQPPFISQPNFVYVHKKHQDLVQDFTRVLQEIIRDGTYDALFAEARKPR